MSNMSNMSNISNIPIAPSQSPPVMSGRELFLPGGLTIWTGDLGLQIYEEIHENEYNRALHIAFLPFVFYGVFRCIPALIGDPRQPRLSIAAIISILFIYGGFYFCTDVSAGYDTVLANLPIVFLALQKLMVPLRETSRMYHVVFSLVLLTGALIIQEIVGHSLWEEVNSRMTASYVLNAIMYSPVFYGQHYHTYYINYPLSALPVMLFSLYELSTIAP